MLGVSSFIKEFLLCQRCFSFGLWTGFLKNKFGWIDKKYLTNKNTLKKTKQKEVTQKWQQQKYNTTSCFGFDSPKNQTISQITSIHRINISCYIHVMCSSWYPKSLQNMEVSQYLQILFQKYIRNNSEDILGVQGQVIFGRFVIFTSWGVISCSFLEMWPLQFPGINQ